MVNINKLVSQIISSEFDPVFFYGQYGVVMVLYSFVTRISKLDLKINRLLFNSCLIVVVTNPRRLSKKEKKKKDF